MTQPRHSKVSGWLFSLLVALVVVTIVAVSLYLAGLHSNWITLNDRSASSISVATDLDAYRILLSAGPSPIWQEYAQRITREGLGHVTRDLPAFRRMQAAGRIIELPNGTRAIQEDQIVLTAYNNALYRTAFQAFKIRVRKGPRKGLEAWTSPDLVRHEGPPPLP
jgi:hypothetical protein